MGDKIFYAPLLGNSFAIEATLVEKSLADLLDSRAPETLGVLRRVMLHHPPVILTGPDIPGHELINRDSLQAQVDAMGKPDNQQIDTLMAVEINTEVLGKGQIPLLEFLLGTLQRIFYYKKDILNRKPSWKCVIEQVVFDPILHEQISFHLFHGETIERRHYERLLGDHRTKSSIEKYLRELREKHPHTTEITETASNEKTASSRKTRKQPDSTIKAKNNSAPKPPHSQIDKKGHADQNKAHPQEKHHDTSREESTKSEEEKNSTTLNEKTPTSSTLSDRVNRIRHAADRAEQLNLLSGEGDK